MSIDPAIDPTAEAATEPQPSQQDPQPSDSTYTPPDAPVQQAASPNEAALAPQGETQPAPGSDAADEEAVDTATALKDVVTFDTVVRGRGKDTTPLPENGGPPVPPLSEGTVLIERYQVATFIGVVHETNMYRVTDLQGYKRCWACGS